MSKYKNTILLYNPKAGKLQRNPQLLERIQRILKEDGHNVTAVPTTGPGTAGQLAAEKANTPQDLLLVFGGDGTLNEAINGMIGSKAVIGQIPGGTANVLACETGMGTNPEKAAARINSLIPTRVAAGRLTATGLDAPRHFLLMCGGGVDARIASDVDARVKARFGKLAYWLAGFAQLARPIEEFEVTAGGKTIRASFALASRVRNYGGDLNIARNISLVDPRYECVFFEGSSGLKYLGYLCGVLLGRTAAMRGVTVMHADSYVLTSPSNKQILLQSDGEITGQLPATIDMVPNAINLLLPQAYLDKAAKYKARADRSLADG